MLAAQHDDDDDDDYPYIHDIDVHRKIVLYHNSSVWLDTQVASNWDRTFALDMVSNCLAFSVTYVSSVIKTHVSVFVDIYLLS